MRTVLCSIAALALALGLVSPLCGSAPADIRSEYTVHASIRIDSNSDFIAANGVTGGSGTAADPWRIEGWDINGALHAFCMYVGNTTQHFAISGCKAHNASGDFVSHYYTESGIIFYNVTNGRISGTMVENNNFDGICLYNSTGCALSGNAVRGNEYGVTIMDWSSNNSISGSAVENNNYYGMGLIDADANLVCANTVRWNGAGGICVSNGSNNSLDANNVEGNDNGIDLWEAENNSVTGNRLCDNTDGIHLEYSDLNRIENNNASGNLEYGIRLALSAGNLIFHNRLENNSVAEAMDSSGGNAWDGGYPSGGNWWAYYAGQDADGDGFGDLPYLGIRGSMGSRDRYPLMRPWFDDTEAPVANAGPDMIVNEDSEIAFNGTASHDNVGIVNYTWQFDSVSGAVFLCGALRTHLFAEPGLYTVTLSAADSAGNIGTDSAVVTVLDITAPVADAGPDFEAVAGACAALDGSASSDNVGITNYTWNFTENGTSVLLYGSMPAVVFPTPGNSSVWLTVMDAAGNTCSDSVAVRVIAPEHAEEVPEQEEPPADPEPEPETTRNSYFIIIVIAVICIIAAVILMRLKKPDS